MIRSVAKHRYTKGRQGKAKARAHVNYIAFRGGEERQQGGRRFFDQDRDDIEAREVKQLIHEKTDERGVVIHKLVLSPGVDADTKEYTRELMEKIERDKGLELEWRAVSHENTEHKHVHVVILGTDRQGRIVRFDKEDYRRLRQYGDEYLDREHKLERYLDREIETLLRSKGYDRGGDESFKQLLFGELDDRERKKKERDEDPERDRREFERLDEDLRRVFNKKPELYPTRGEQRIREQAGKLAEYHGDYTSAMAIERLERIAEENPERAETIREDIEYMREMSKENRIDQKRDPVLEELLGFSPQMEKARDRNEKQNADNAAQTFENDRLARPEEQGSEKEQERDRDDGSEL